MNSFLQGKKTLTVPPLRAPAAVVRPPHISTAESTPRSAAPAACSGGAPSVEVVKEGDKVVRLIVSCTCGERVEIECLYPAS